MSVDKFGHFSSYKNEVFKKDAHKWLGFTVDKDKNFNLQNKRIKNVQNPLEEKDAVNKGYLFSQIYNEQKILKNGINVEIIRVRDELSQVKAQIKTILDIQTILNVEQLNKNKYNSN